MRKVPEVDTRRLWKATGRFEATPTVSVRQPGWPSCRHWNSTERGIRPDRRLVRVSRWPTGNSPPAGSTDSPVK